MMTDNQLLKNKFCLAVTLASNFDKEAIMVFYHNSNLTYYFNLTIPIHMLCHTAKWVIILL